MITLRFFTVKVVESLRFLYLYSVGNRFLVCGGSQDALLNVISFYGAVGELHQDESLLHSFWDRHGVARIRVHVQTLGLTDDAISYGPEI